MSPPPRRGRKRGNGEGTITRRADGRCTAAIYVIRPDGTRGRKWVYGATRAEVARKLVDLTQRVNAGVVMPTRSPTVGEYLDLRLAEVALPRLRPTTIAKYRTAIERYLRPALGTQKLDQLTVATVQRFLKTRGAAGDSVQKLRWIREVLSSALGRAQREELVMRNVAQLTTLPTEQRRRRLAWTGEQSRRFLDAARGDAARNLGLLDEAVADLENAARARAANGAAGFHVESRAELAVTLARRAGPATRRGLTRSPRTSPRKPPRWAWRRGSSGRVGWSPGSPRCSAIR